MDLRFEVVAKQCGIVFSRANGAARGKRTAGRERFEKRTATRAKRLRTENFILSVKRSTTVADAAGARAWASPSFGCRREVRECCVECVHPGADDVEMWRRVS